MTGAIAITIAMIPVLMINPRVLFHQPENNMVQLFVGLLELSLYLPQFPFHNLQCPYMFRYNLFVYHKKEEIFTTI
jgi:hypothetical protein